MTAAVPSGAGSPAARAAAAVAGARTSGGFPVTDTIGIAVLILIVVLVLVMLAWWLGRPNGRTPGLPGWAPRTRRIQQAAAEDVAAVRRDARLVRPDAPGNYPDEL